MKLGDVVKHKRYGYYGTVEYSTFGFSIHTWKDGYLTKSLGFDARYLSKHWEVIELPEGCRKHENGGIVDN
jgi:hypothetical protein